MKTTTQITTFDNLVDEAIEIFISNGYTPVEYDENGDLSESERFRLNDLYESLLEEMMYVEDFRIGGFRNLSMAVLMACGANREDAFHMVDLLDLEETV
jgi:hypothetical protein